MYDKHRARRPLPGRNGNGGAVGLDDFVDRFDDTGEIGELGWELKARQQRRLLFSESVSNPRDRLDPLVADFPSDLIYVDVDRS